MGIGKEARWVTKGIGCMFCPPQNRESILIATLSNQSGIIFPFSRFPVFFSFFDFRSVLEGLLCRTHTQKDTGLSFCLMD
jgi:hypothetical protein